MAEEVAGVGKGFFDKAGRLKSRDQLTTESTDKSSEANSQATEVDFNSKVDNAFGAVKSRFLEQAGNAISVVNQSRDLVKEAGGVVKEQIAVARDLKDAIKAGDTETADAKRAELEELSVKRDEIASKIDQSNRDLDPERNQSLRVGNTQVGRVEVDRVEFSSRESGDLNSVEDVKNFISELKTDRAGLKDQLQDLRAAKKEVKSIISDVKSNLREIENSTIESYSSASIKAEDIASEIRAGSQQVFAQNVDENVVRNLLS